MFPSSSKAPSNVAHVASSSQADYARQKSPDITALEQEVLDEYQRLHDNMNKLSSTIATLTAQPTSQILDSLRQLERKTGLVYTLLKASVYSIVLQQEMHDADVVGGGADIDDMLDDE